MGTLSFTISYKKNQQIVFSPNDLKNLYLFGLKLENKYGQEISEQSLETIILMAQEQVEKYLDIKLQKQVISEKLSFNRNDFERFGFVNTSYPVSKVYKLNGMIGSIEQITYPVEWLYIRETSDKETYYRQISVIPVASNVITSPVIYGGWSPYLGYLGQSNIPHYWFAQYITGFEKIPNNLLSIIGKYAALTILYQLSNIVMGVPGLSSLSLGLDGLSQSTSSSNAFMTTIKGYTEALKVELVAAHDFYKGILFSSC